MKRITRRGIIAAGGGAVGLATLAASRDVFANTLRPVKPETDKVNLNGRFKNKVVLITGATSGIGKTTAIAFAREGAKVVFCGRRTELGQKVQDEIKQAGGDALYVRADVTRPADIEALIATTVKTYGRIDIAFNNAGFEGSLGEMHETTMENWDTVMNTNLRGVWLSMKAEIPQMQKQGGVIVNTSSVQGLASNPGFTAYTASKHGILGLTKTAALENATRNIRVNAVCPGPIDTAMTDRTLVGAPITKAQLGQQNVPVKRIGRPEEVARAVLWLSTDEASFVTGTFLTIDGGVIAKE